MTRLWWLYLVAGVLWVLFGMWLWSYRVGSLVALAALLGVTAIFNGVTEVLVGAAIPLLRWFLVAVGGLSIVGGIVILAWPGPTLYVIAVFLSLFLVAMGAVHVIEAFMRLGESYWWLRLIQGAIELLLGGWAHGNHVRSLFLLLTLAGAFAVVRGVNAIFAAFELRRLGELLAKSAT